ncbi:MAG: hypothetical protein UX81_C0016G0014 [Parcubacteria group bacterium GW2011_GWA2_47_12]|nr:MAG: hypothetical protein UX81_C0016G0014 [Parcubacteria group bacterium GW2011_GWA2_47_12]
MKEGRESIMANWDAAHNRLDETDAGDEILRIASVLNRTELEEYLKHNFDNLTERQRTFILASLNAKLSNEGRVVSGQE